MFSPCNRVASRAALTLRLQINTHPCKVPMSCISTTKICLKTDEKSSIRKTKILYDGGCSICEQEMKVVRYLNKDKDVLELVDITKPGYNPAEHNNVTYKEAMAELHVIDKDNKIHKRVPATHLMYETLGHGWMTSYTKWPILEPLFDKAYG